MKKTVFTVCLLLGMSFYSTAQTGFDLGASGTFNSAWILKQNDYGTLAAFTNAVVQKSRLNYSATWGGNGGICLGYKATEHWAFQAEVQYNVTGQKYNDNLEGPATIPEGTFGGINSRVNVQRVVKLSYVQIPLLAKYSVGKKKIKFFAAMGPQVGIRTSAYEQIKIAGYVYLPDSLNFTTNQKFKTWDLGLALQAGGQFYTTPHLYFEVALSAYQGVVDINGPEIEPFVLNHNSVYYQSYNFRVGIMFGIHYIFGHDRGGLLPLSKPADKS